MEKQVLDEASFRAHVLKTIQQEQEEHGEAHIQKQLQTEIQTVKKRMAEALALDKQLRNQRGETDALRRQLLQYQDLKKKGETVCRTLQVTIKRRDDLTKAMSEEMKATREKTITETKEKVLGFRQSSETRKQAVEASQEENKRLRSEVESLQDTFKAECEKFQSEVQTMFAPSPEIQDLQKTANEVNALQEQLKAVETQNSACVAGATVMEGQLAWYCEKVKEFEEIAVDPIAVKIILEKHRVAGEERVAEARSQTESLKQKRTTAESELQELRVKYAALNKKLIEVESNKKAAEKACRAAQNQPKK